MAGEADLADAAVPTPYVCSIDLEPSLAWLSSRPGLPSGIHATVVGLSVGWSAKAGAAARTVSIQVCAVRACERAATTPGLAMGFVGFVVGVRWWDSEFIKRA